MRVKTSVAGDKMSVVDGAIGDARRMSDYVLQRKFRGPGDTIERAAYEAEQTWGVPASILLRLRHRHEIKDMLLSNWMRLKVAYDAAVESAQKQQQHQEKLARAALVDETTSGLFKLAAILGRSENGAAE